MQKGYPSKLQRSVVGYASAGFAEAVKMPCAEARGASLFLTLCLNLELPAKAIRGLSEA
jgi:hypothetical protein